MSNVVRLPNHAVILEEACAWLTRVDRGLSSEERKNLHLWVEESVLHRRALAEAVATWDDMDRLEELADIFPLDRYAEPSKNDQSRRHHRLLPALAALVLLVIGGWYGLGGADAGSFLRLIGVETLLRGSDTQYRTALGQRTSILLPDGSRMTLNTNTLVTVRMDKSWRTIRILQGEAFFEVAHDKNRPFRVIAHDRTVTAIGTAFSVRMDEDRLDVLVTEGVVQLTAPELRGREGPLGAGDGVGRLAANEHAAFKDGNLSLKVFTASDAAANTAWRQGMLVFNNEPLERALAEFSRYTPVEFVFGDDAIRTISVGGFFRVDDMDGLLLALYNNFNIEAERDHSGRVILKQR